MLAKSLSRHRSESLASDDSLVNTNKPQGFTTVQKAWNDDSLVNTKPLVSTKVSKWCEMDFVHPP